MRKAKGLRKLTGLMFRSVDTEPLKFEFNKNVKHPIHSAFVFFHFIAIWLDEREKVISWDIVEPFTYSVNSIKPYRKLIEIPLHEKNKDLIKKFLGDVNIEKFI